MSKNLFIKILIFLFLINKIIISAQSESRIEVTKTYLIKNAFVVTKPGASPVLQSVLIKDGIINQIGNVKPTFDAKVINVDSMFLYAGFIDAASFTGHKKEEEKKDVPKPPSKGQANFEQSGITPQINALAKFSPKESSVSDMRKAGFTVSQVFPKGKMVAGTSSVFLLKDVDHEDKVLFSQNNGMLSSFTTSSVNPSTVIGVIAKYKDILKNTEIAIKNLNVYNQNPSGIKRPTYSEELTALMPVVKKEMPFYFVANNSKDIFRAINLQKEFGFKMVLTEVKQSMYSLPQIKSGGFPVLFSLDLPDEIKDEKEEGKKDEKKEDKQEKKEEKVEEKKDTKKEEKKDEKPKKELTEEEKALTEKKKKSYDEYLRQVADLEKNNIPFSFSYFDVKVGDIHKSIKRLIKAGLSENGALAALTTTPANLIGQSKTLGTIEVGKVANIVITDKPLFAEKSEVKFVFVDGQPYEYNEKKKSETKIDEKGVKIEGVWSFSVDIPGSTQTGKIIFEKDGTSYKGHTIADDTPDEKEEIRNLSIEGDKVKFEITVDMGQQMEITFELNFSGDSYSGNVSIGAMGSFPIKGSKISGPKIFNN